jgi:RNA polymerase sigma factor (sigma-70 family)
LRQPQPAKDCACCNAGRVAGNSGVMNRPAGPEDRSARFEALFRAEYPAVAGYIGRRVQPDLVDDLVDEVFLVAWRRLERVPAEPRPWLLTVARNVLGTHIRGAQRRRALNVRLAATQVDRTSPAALADGEAAAALAAMRPKDREALLLVSWEGLSPSEAARVLGERPVSFRSRLHRARSRFRKALEKAGSDADVLPTEPRIDALTISTEVHSD